MHCLIIMGHIFASGMAHFAWDMVYAEPGMDGFSVHKCCVRNAKNFMYLNVNRDRPAGYSLTSNWSVHSFKCLSLRKSTLLAFRKNDTRSRKSCVKFGPNIMLWWAG